jgi:hypothetical protein
MTYFQSRVSPHANENAALTNEERLANLEYDVTSQSEAMKQLVHQNSQYAEYLEDRIKRESESYLFWRDVRKKTSSRRYFGISRDNRVCANLRLYAMD